jgi:hypothetical protein
VSSIIAVVQSPRFLQLLKTLPNCIVCQSLCRVVSCRVSGKNGHLARNCTAPRAAGHGPPHAPADTP